MSDTTRQIVYRYPSYDSGSCDFAVWHIGASVVTVYSPEGGVRRVITLDAPERELADAAAETHRQVVSATGSPGLYQ